MVTKSENQAKNPINSKYAYTIGLGVAILLVSIIAIFFIIKPFYSKAKQVTAEKNSKQQELDNLKDKKSKLEKMKDREEELSKNAEIVRNALPEGKDVGRLFIQLDALAGENRGNIKSVSEGSTGAATAVASTDSGVNGVQKVVYAFPVDFTSYFDYKSFLIKAESALRLLNLDGVSVTASDSGSINTSVSATTYVRSNK